MIDKLLEEFLNKITDKEEEKVKEPIGIVSDELRREFENWIEQRDDLEAEVEFKIKRLKQKVVRQLEKEYESIIEECEAEREELWKRIRGELNILSETDLNINTDTGVISKWVKPSINRDVH